MAGNSAYGGGGSPFDQGFAPGVQYPRPVFNNRSSASSVNSADIRNGRHGVMAKCKCHLKFGHDEIKLT